MGKHKAPFLNNEVISLVENNKTPEQQLWIAVLAKAFDDAFKSMMKEQHWMLFVGLDMDKTSTTFVT